jgi:hypothetical protein
MDNLEMPSRPTSQRIRRLTGWEWPAGFAVVQFPNPPLIVALLASVAGHFTHGTGHRVALAVFYLTLGLWAYEEARHGENWFRRLLGLGFSIYILVSLTRALRG